MSELELRLHPLLGHRAVLQRGRPLRIYGSASPGMRVDVELGGQSASADAGADGIWEATLPPRDEGGPFELTVTSASGRRVTSHDLVIGDVWLASGQSNMERTLAQCHDAEAEIARSTDPDLRCFTVLKAQADQPLEHCNGHWLKASPEVSAGFSGVGFYFARSLRRELKVPIGIIVSALGGTRIAAWMPREMLDPRDEIPAPSPAEDVELDAPPYESTPNEGQALGFARPDFDASDWEPFEVPGVWQERGYRFNGAVWFRREIELPESFRGQELTLELGAIDDFDVSYVNGQRVGAIGPEYKNAQAIRRSYPVRTELTRTDKLVVAVRVFDQWGIGGIVGPAPALRLSRTDDPEHSLPLAGTWWMKIERKLVPWRVWASDFGTSELYHAMIHPLRRSPIRGALFYQGESDVNRARRYALLLPKLIESWRSLFRDPKLPFLLVQLAGFKPAPTEPVDDEWAELREAQTAALRLPYTGIAVALDVGDPDDIHPANKRSVGERLAQWALGRVYGRDVVPSGPLYASHQVEGNAVRVSFKHAVGLRTRNDQRLLGFQIAGADRRFRWAEARIDGESVLVSHRGISAPSAVRYGWAGSSPANLENAAGLPASPFRTDSWPGVTDGVF